MKSTSLIFFSLLATLSWVVNADDGNRPERLFTQQGSTQNGANAEGGQTQEGIRYIDLNKNNPKKASDTDGNQTQEGIRYIDLNKSSR